MKANNDTETHGCVLSCSHCSYVAAKHSSNAGLLFPLKDFTGLRTHHILLSLPSWILERALSTMPGPPRHNLHSLWVGWVNLMLIAYRQTYMQVPLDGTQNSSWMTMAGKVCSEYLFHWFEVKVKAAAGMVFRVGQAVSQHEWHLCAAMVASPSAETSDQPNVVQLFEGSVSCLNVDRLLVRGLYGQIVQLDQFSVACIVMGTLGHMGTIKEFTSN